MLSVTNKTLMLSVVILNVVAPNFCHPLDKLGRLKFSIISSVVETLHGSLVCYSRQYTKMFEIFKRTSLFPPKLK